MSPDIVPDLVRSRKKTHFATKVTNLLSFIFLFFRFGMNETGNIIKNNYDFFNLYITFVIKRIMQNKIPFNFSYSRSNFARNKKKIRFKVPYQRRTPMQKTATTF